MHKIGSTERKKVWFELSFGNYLGRYPIKLFIGHLSNAAKPRLCIMLMMSGTRDNKSYFQKAIK